MVRMALTTYIGFCAYIVLLLQCLSAFQQVTFWPVVLGTVCGVVVIARLLALDALARRRTREAERSPRVRRFTLSPSRLLASRLIRALRSVSNPVVLPFLIVLTPLIILLIAQGWHFPPNDQDALNYHLARAAYWRQFHSLGHYYTTSGPSVAYPGNVEALFTWLLVLFSSGRPVFMVQLLAYVASILANITRPERSRKTDARRLQMANCDPTRTSLRRTGQSRCWP